MSSELFRKTYKCNQNLSESVYIFLSSAKLLYRCAKVVLN